MKFLSVILIAAAIASQAGAQDTTNSPATTGTDSAALNPFDDGKPAVEEASGSGSNDTGVNVGDDSTSGSGGDEAGVSAAVSAKSITLGVSAVAVTFAAAFL